MLLKEVAFHLQYACDHVYKMKKPQWFLTPLWFNRRQSVWRRMLILSKDTVCDDERCDTYKECQFYCGKGGVVVHLNGFVFILAMIVNHVCAFGRGTFSRVNGLCVFFAHSVGFYKKILRK